MKLFPSIRTLFDSMGLIMRALKLLSGIAALCFWFSSFFVWLHFDTYGSTIAEPESGRVFQLNTHGSVVYLTAGEHNLLYGLIVAGVMFFLFTVILHLLERRKS
jgi:hypothetical protein